MKIRQVGAELFRAAEGHGRTGMTKVIVTFRNSVNSPNRGTF
jgi:hypothetical protein